MARVEIDLPESSPVRDRDPDPDWRRELWRHLERRRPRMPTLPSRTVLAVVLAAAGLIIPAAPRSRSPRPRPHTQPRPPLSPDRAATGREIPLTLLSSYPRSRCPLLPPPPPGLGERVRPPGVGGPAPRHAPRLRAALLSLCPRHRVRSSPGRAAAAALGSRRAGARRRAVARPLERRRQLPDAGRPAARAQARLLGVNALETFGPVHRWGGWRREELLAIARLSARIAAVGALGLHVRRPGGPLREAPRLVPRRRPAARRRGPRDGLRDGRSGRGRAARDAAGGASCRRGDVGEGRAAADPDERPRGRRAGAARPRRLRPDRRHAHGRGRRARPHDVVTRSARRCAPGRRPDRPASCTCRTSGSYRSRPPCLQAR